MINVGGTWNLLTESIKALFENDANGKGFHGNKAVMPSYRQQNP
ncbi:hypothetical protein [Persicobacter diffluens]